MPGTMVGNALQVHHARLPHLRDRCGRVRRATVPARRHQLRRPEIPRGLRALRLREPGCAQGRHAGARHGTELQQLHADHRQGDPAAGDPRHRTGHALRPAVLALGRRTRQFLRQPGGRGRPGGGLLVGDLPPAPGSTVARRRAGHGPRREIHLRLDRRRRGRRSPAGVPVHRGQRDPGRARNPVRLPEPERPEPQQRHRDGQVADRPGALLARSGHDEDHPGAPARQRSLPRRGLPPGAIHPLRACARLLGAPPRHPSRPAQLRLDPLRRLS